MAKTRTICLCNTYFQLITAIQLRRILFADDHFALVLTNASNGADRICEKLRELAIFDEVYYADRARETAEGFHSRRAKIDRFLQYFADGSYTSYLRGTYDLFLAFNMNWYTFMLYSALERDNHAIRAARFEEGLVSYFVDEHRNDFAYFQRIWKIKRLLRQPRIFEQLHDFYCFYPELYAGKLHPVQIPPIDRNDSWFRDTLCALFDVDVKKLNYDKKYIYFASMIDSEILKKDGEFAILRDIAEVVGKDNLIVKLHPREENRQRYADLGVTIDTNSDIPFEIIQLVRDFSANVFITCLSGSVLNFASILPERTRTYFTYGMLPEKNAKIDQICEIYEKVIPKMNEVTGTDDFIVLRSRAQMERELGTPEV